MPYVVLESLLACVAPAPDGGSEGFTVGLEASADIGTVAVVTVDAPADASVRVDVQEAGGPVRSFAGLPLDEGGQAAQLVGLAARTVYTWNATVTLADGTAWSSASATFETPFEPVWLPMVQASTAAADPWASGFVLTTVVGESPAIAILDRQGRYVWWWQSASGLMPCQARVARDGSGILALLVDQEMVEPEGALLRLAWGGEEAARTEVPLAHHDFLELPDGRVGLLTFDVRAVDGVDVVGDALAVGTPALGDFAPIWSTWDDLEPVTDGEAFYGEGIDWSHANGLARDDASGEWLVSLHNLDTLVRLGADGALKWQLGGSASDFALADGKPFGLQHSPVLTPDGVLLFDNGDRERLSSRALELRVDTEARNYSTLWSWSGAEPLFSGFMGAVERLPDGHTLIGWGSIGRITEVDGSDEVAWQLDLEVGSPLGFTHAVSTLGETRE